MLVSVVIPCYNSERSIRQVVELTMAEFDRMPAYECEFVLVNDYSRDHTFEVIKQLAAQYPCVHGISLMRNFSQHNATMCAFHYAQGELILGMDDDLQCHPSQIPLILNKMEEGYDLVYGVYPSRKNSALKNFTSWLNRVTSRKLLGRPKGIEASNFWVLTRQMKDEMIKYKNYNPEVDALFTRMTSNIGNVTIEHHKREYGSSGYTLKKLIHLWLSYFNYTVVPLRFVSIMGGTTAGLGFVFGIITAIRKLLGPGMPAGWASIICIMLLFFGMVLLSLGIIGEYIGNIVLTLNSTPQYIIREKVNL